ncbi:Abscisic acid G-protein coupled receptor-domain-containing protein [Crassisporium funariophilum]|nr:Abscisic acid G-protein coupled receptor-domain-containing protein [Crassisporium funariophilum]
MIGTNVLRRRRFSLFFASRKYLLRILYSDLQSLSSSSTVASTPGTPISTRYSRPGSPSTPNGIELDTLPLPSTHTPKSRTFFSNEATSIHSSVSRTVFSWCFAESCMMFSLLMLQGLDVFSARTRLLNWRFSLFFLMTAILVVIPLSVSLLLAIGTSSTRRSLLGARAIFSLIPVVLYLFALSYIPLPIALASSDTTTAALSRLIVLGTIILGLLSGFGAISSSWKFLPFVSRDSAVPSEQDIDTAQYALTSVRNDMRTRREEATRREGSTVEGSWFSRVGASFRGGDNLTQEIQGLEALEYQMSRNLEALRERRDTAKFASTFKGRIYNLAGRIFTFYCISRVFSSIYNIVFLPAQRSSSKTTYPDLITDLLAHLISRVSHAQVEYEDLSSFARQLSLGLVGLIILSSIRLVLKGATRALRVTSRNLAASLMLLVLAQIMGIYLLSTIVQMRASFPPPLSHNLPDDDGSSADPVNLFSTIPAYEVFGSLFDWSFLLSAGASAFMRWGGSKDLFS